MDLSEQACGLVGKWSEMSSLEKYSLLDGHTLPAQLTCGSGRATGMNLLISSSGDSPVKICPSPDDVPDSPENAPGSSMKSFESLKPFSRRGGSLKMFQGCLALTPDGIWPRSLKDFGNAGLWSATQCWTASISESRNVAAACSLSAVLQKQVLPKYSLSPKAAAGILRRASKRGRTLLPALGAALRDLASTHQVAAGKTI